MALGGAAWALGAGPGCRRAHDEAAGERLAVEYGSCASVLAGPVCVPRAERQLVLWVPGADAEVAFTGGRVVGEPVAVQGGRRFRVQVDPRASRLTARAGAAGWSLALSSEPAPAWVADARGRLRQNDVDGAQAVVDQHLAQVPGDRPFASSVLARIELARGNNKDEAERLLRVGIEEHRAHGRLLAQVDDITVLARTLLRARRLEDVRALLASLPEGGGLPAEASYYAHYYRGLLALTTADLRTALHRLEDAAQQAERIGVARLQRPAEQLLAETLRLLGHTEEAEARLSRLVREAPADMPACERADLLNDAGWNRWLGRDAGEPSPDPAPFFAEALALFQGPCGGHAVEERNVQINLALTDVQGGRLGPARSRYEGLGPLAGTPLPLELWRQELGARLELAEGKPARALRSFTAFDALASATASPAARWRAAVGRARALEALGRAPEALAAYAEAEDRLESHSLQVPIDEGQEGFAARNAEATRLHLDLLLRRGRTGEAFALSRRSRARAVAHLAREARLAGLSPEERRAWDGALSAYRQRKEALTRSLGSDWALPADRLRQLAGEREAAERELGRALDQGFTLLQGGPRGGLRPPAADEAMLLYHPLPRGWVGFAADRAGVAAARLACEPSEPSAERLGACLLGPFAAQIRRAARVTLLAYGPTARLDLHALPLDGTPLLAGREVVWSLDLAPEPAAAGPEGAASAVLAVDPRGDLPAARAEARQVEASLRGQARPWAVERLEGDAVRPAELVPRLQRADLFHYAGHGRFGGAFGWDSALLLAGATELTVADVLALTRAPRWAVLSGCETARSSARVGEGLGLAQAFVARGSRAVVAASRDVDDPVAAFVVESFYRNLAGGLSPAASLRRAQLALHQHDTRADWAAFRILEP